MSLFGKRSAMLNALSFLDFHGYLLHYRSWSLTILFCMKNTDVVVRLWNETFVKTYNFLPSPYLDAAKEILRTLYLPLSDEIVAHEDESSGELDTFFAFFKIF